MSNLPYLIFISVLAGVAIGLVFGMRLERFWRDGLAKKAAKLTAKAVKK